MAAQWPWLTVTAAVSAEPDYRGETGTVADVIQWRVPPTARMLYMLQAIADGSRSQAWLSCSPLACWNHPPSDWAR